MNKQLSKLHCMHLENHVLGGGGGASEQVME